MSSEGSSEGKKGRRYWIWLRCGFMLVLAALLAVGFRRYVRDTDWACLTRVRPDWSLFILGVVFGAASRFLLPLGWLLALRRMGGAEMPMRDALRVYAYSWMARYMPGKAMIIVARMTVAAHYGISTAAVGLASFFELVVQMAVSLSAGLIGLLAWPGALTLLGRGVLILLVVLPLLCALVSPPVLNFIIVRRCRRKGLPAPESRVDFGMVARVAGLVAVFSFCFALQSCWMLASVADRVFDHAWFLWGALNISRIAGLAAVGVPAGLGVREAVQVMLLSLCLPKEAVLSGVVMMRLGDVLADLLFVGAAGLLARRRIPSRIPAEREQARAT